MKHFFLMALALVAALILGSCDKTENGDGEKNELDQNYFAQKYTVDADGYCMLEGAEPLPEAEIASKVTGYGWKTVGTYEVEPDGRLSTKDYWADRLGGSATNYWFESSTKLTSYFYMDALPADCFSKLTWNYDAQKGFIMRCSPNDATSDKTDKYMQVMKIGETHGKTLMYTMQKLGYRTDSKGTKSTFGMVIYQRMTDKELDDTKRQYTHDADKDRTTVNTESDRKYILGKFKTLPKDADIKMYWKTSHSNMALVLMEDKEEPLNSQYYVRAEPK